MTASPRVPHLRHAGFVLLALALVAWAFANRLVVDDAFIYYRYAQNWLDGLGLVWNPGEAVEGFTSLPWVLWVAACLRIGLDPALTGLAFFGIALGLLHAAAREASGSEWIALLVVAVYGTNYTIACFATGGLETSLHLMLLVLALGLLLRVLGAEPVRAIHLAALSVVLGVAFTVRMDSAVCVVPILAAAAWHTSRGPEPRPRLMALGVPAAAIALAFVGVRLALFGALVPNTFQVKLGGERDLARGFDYAALFHHDNLLYLAALPALVACITLGGRAPRLSLRAAALGAVWATWCAYVVWIGGDFMEFRMMAPALSPLLLFVALLWRHAHAMRALLAVALVVVCVHNGVVGFEMRRATSAPFGVALSHNRFPFYAIPPGADSVPLLRAHLAHPQDDWIGVGRRLGEVFEHSPDVLIATTAAGAIPYFSRLPTVDMLGLNDRWIAREGRALTSRPGHGRGATASYMLERGVDLVIAHPILVPRDRLPEALAGVSPERFWFDRAPAGARLIALPVNSSHAVVLLYLGQNPVIDSAIAREGLLVLVPPRPNG